MYQHTLTHFWSRFYEVVNLFCDSILSVKKNLILLVQPIESQIGYTDTLPHVPHLGSRTIDNMGHFISHDKFQILRSKLIPNK